MISYGTCWGHHWGLIHAGVCLHSAQLVAERSKWRSMVYQSKVNSESHLKRFFFFFFIIFRCMLILQLVSNWSSRELLSSILWIDWGLYILWNLDGVRLLYSLLRWDTNSSLMASEACSMGHQTLIFVQIYVFFEPIVALCLQALPCVSISFMHCTFNIMLFLCSPILFFIF